MRILMTADAVGGVWTYCLELARALAPKGVTVALATMGPLPRDEQRAEATAVPGLELHESDFKLEWQDEPWEDVRRAGDWLLELERRLTPAVVHLNGYAHGALPWRAPLLVVGHSCVLSWWEAVKGRDAPSSWDRYRAAVSAGLRTADLVVAPTRAMLAALERHYGRLPASRAIPNGRDPAQFLPGEKEPLVLAAGRLWDEAKNIAALAEVAAELPWPVCVAGDDRHPDGGRVEYANVRMLGRLPQAELAGWVGRAAIYALPARYEPFGLSALEAAFAGCALVLGDIPTLREVWGDAALFVPPGDRGALRDVLRDLIADGEARQALAARARARAFEFTPERMAGGYLAAYRYLLEPGAPTGAEVTPELTEAEEEPVCAS